jgi:hypothetical protein
VPGKISPLKRVCFARRVCPEYSRRWSFAHSIGWIDGSMDRWIDGSMDRWIDGSMDRWIDSKENAMQTNLHSEKSQRAFKAMVPMKKFNIAEIKHAYDGSGAAGYKVETAGAITEYHCCVFKSADFNDV